MLWTSLWPKKYFLFTSSKDGIENWRSRRPPKIRFFKGTSGVFARKTSYSVINAQLLAFYFVQFPNQKHLLIVKFRRLFNSSVTCVALIIKYQSWNDFTPHYDLFSLGSALLLLVLFVNFQFVPSTSAAPIDCQKNTAVCFEEIMKELTQLRFEVKILTENRTLVRCTFTLFLNCTGYSILSLSLYSVSRKR